MSLDGEGGMTICVGRAGVVQVGHNTTIDLMLDANV